MADPTYPLFTVFAFLGFVLALVPLPWHLHAWNAGTCIYMLWTSLASLIEFVDSIVWRDSVRIVAPVYCDITTKFLIGAGVGIPAASLCINRRLYTIATTKVVSITRRDKRNTVLIDLAIAVGIPVMVMVLHYVVQGHRFNVIEEVGCTPTIYNTALAYPLVNIWPLLLGCVSFVYAALTLRAFWIRRVQFNKVLSTTNALTISRYFRLMLLAFLDMSCTIPLTAYSIYVNNKGVTLAPWISWSNVHYDFSFIDQIPAVIWKSNPSFVISVQMGRWIYPCCAIVFFLLFGFAQEARRHYRVAFWTIAKRFGFHPTIPQASVKSPFGYPLAAKDGKTETTDTLPAYAPPTPVRRKRPESLSSSLAGSVLDVDLEKALDSPFPLNDDNFSRHDPLPSPQLSEPCNTETAGGSPLESRIVISEEYPASIFPFQGMHEQSDLASVSSPPLSPITPTVPPDPATHQPTSPDPSGHSF